jgi:hypothetical protein
MLSVEHPADIGDWTLRRDEAGGDGWRVSPIKFRPQ